MPFPVDGGAPLCSAAFACACAAIPHRGEIYVLCGMRSDIESPLRTLVVYRAATNSWSAAAPMPTPRSFFSARAIGGWIFVAGGGDGGISTVECYEPESDQWALAAGMRCGMARYDAAVVGRRMYVMEGWRWPFYVSPMAGVYDGDRDAWEEMSEGLRDGWTGASDAEICLKISRCGHERRRPTSISGGGIAGFAVQIEAISRPPFGILEAIQAFKISTGRRGGRRGGQRSGGRRARDHEPKPWNLEVFGGCGVHRDPLLGIPEAAQLQDHRWCS